VRIAVVKYNAGNVRSVLHALSRLGVEAEVSDSPEVLQTSARIIFPGVGEAGSAMKSLQSTGLDALLPTLTQPFLGICLGMQLLAQDSEENDTSCLGILPGNIARFTKAKKVPHIGWNTLERCDDLIFRGLSENPYVYYVHCYFLPTGPRTISTTVHGEEFSAAVRQKNFVGVQFHPEKSGDVGQQILRNFLDHD